MAGAGERDFVWAKACGVVGKAFLGRRLSRLYSVARLSELDRLAFPDSPSNLPEKELSARFERKLAERAASRVVALVSLFAAPPGALVRLVRAFEYADLTRCLAALAAGDAAGPEPTPIGRFRTLRFDAYPDLDRMTSDTEFAWVPSAFTSADALVETESELDRRYYRLLWEDVSRLGGADREPFEEIVAEEVVLKNIVWALRLRVYYGIEGSGVEGRLLDLSRHGVSLAADARSTAAFSLDRPEDWRLWKRSYLLSDAAQGDSWRVDPRLVQNAAARSLYRTARRLFRFSPGSAGAIACFAKLVQYEEDILTSVAEGLALGRNAREVVSHLAGESA